MKRKEDHAKARFHTHRRDNPALALVTGGRGWKHKRFRQLNTRLLRRQPVHNTLVEFSPTAEQTLLQHNASLNFIYQSDPGLPGGQPFISVIDAIPGDGFNPIWEEVQITFTPGHTPRQLFSDNDVGRRRQRRNHAHVHGRSLLVPRRWAEALKRCVFRATLATKGRRVAIAAHSLSIWQERGEKGAGTNDIKITRDTDR